MSIHKKALFYGYNRYFEPPVHENGRFYGREAKKQHPVHKKGAKRGRDEEIKKRYPIWSISRKYLVMRCPIRSGMTYPSLPA